ncbi:MAG TPA: hypothetical protein VFN67_40215 [Polyangiales bacterium]|jgi:hypothetical protein|nr:hypothetical protein [Polyangiales bacterium]
MRFAPGWESSSLAAVGVNTITQALQPMAADNLQIARFSPKA